MKKNIYNLFTKAKSKCKDIGVFLRKNLIALSTAMATLLPMSPMMVFAGTEGEVVPPTDGGAAGGTVAIDTTIIDGILEVIFTIFRYIGILLLAWSVGQLFLAYKNEDAESKSRAMMTLVSAVMLVTIQHWFGLLGIKP